MEACLTDIQKDFDPALYSISTLSAQFSGFVKPGMELEERIAVLTKAAIELTSPEAPDWEKIAARFLNYGFRRRLAAELDRLGIHSFYEKLSYLTEEGLYGDYILSSYSKEELELAASFLDDSRDCLLYTSGRRHFIFPGFLSEYGLRTQPLQLFYRAVSPCKWTQNHELSPSSRREQSVFRAEKSRLLRMDECQKRSVCRSD